MSFDVVCHKIISESINSALYIDDKVLLPFEEAGNETPYINQASLFQSFNENNCLIDFKRYNKNVPIDVDKYLYNKDLLILDWHLNSSDETDLNATFNILEKAINTNSLHFAVIYTNQKQSALPESVILNIASYFSGLDKNISDTFKTNFEKFVDTTGISQENTNTFTETLKRLAIEIFFDLGDKTKSKSRITELQEYLKTQQIEYRDFIAFLNEQSLPRNKFIEKVICLGFILSNSEIPATAKLYKIVLSPDRYTIRIANTYIKVFSKSINDTELYKEFTKSLISESNIFLTLLGLEIRNRFRETSAFIGKELDEVNQLAFFFHRKSHFDGYEHLFNEFLKDIWKDQVASFLLEKDMELFSVIDEYKNVNNIEAGLTKFSNSDGEARNEIATLNLIYNRLVIKRKENDEIRFGDIFYADFGDEKLTYLLCLTPHCDCLRPGKIKNMFFFVEGTDIGVAKGVMKTDGDFISYIHTSNENLTCIDWTNGNDDCKPFSFYIANNKMDVDKKKISFSYFDKDIDWFYLCTIKEKYAQRIANKAFSYPLKVGIDFATFHKSISK